LRHGRGCTGDDSQRDSRIGQSFHHITFILEKPRRNRRFNLDLEGRASGLNLTRVNYNLAAVMIV
jgi:hypothetical protein